MVYFISNTLSVSGRMRRAIRRAEGQFAGQEIVHRQATEIGDYTAFFASLAPEDSVVLLGGDGTLNYLINALDVSAIHNPVYSCMAGTGNDFLRDVLDNKVSDGMLYKINDALGNLPVAEVNGKTYRFLNNLAFGIDGEVCSVMDDLKAKGWKRMNYTVLAAFLLLRYRCPDADVTVDGRSLHLEHVWLAPTMNGRYFGGGMKVAPGQDRFSDQVTFVAFSCKNRLKTIFLFPRLFPGTHVSLPEMTIISGHNVEVRYSEPRDVQMDGEVVRDVLSYRVRKGNTPGGFCKSPPDPEKLGLFSK